LPYNLQRLFSYLRKLQYLYQRIGATKLYEGVRVEHVNTDGKQVTSIQTDHGAISCNFFVNAGGLVRQFVFNIQSFRAL